MLRIKDLCVSYTTGKTILPVIENLSLGIAGGEALAVLGPSGCGKSTLINALAGIISYSGEAELEGEGGSAPLSPKTHRIAVIPQSLGLLPWKTVDENCTLPLKIRGERITEGRRDEIAAVYSSLGLESLTGRYPRALSGGQAQRAAIARAFVQRPHLLLMDEPFSALDAITREEAQGLFLSLWRGERPTTVIVTHSIDEALYLGSRVAVMDSRSGGIKYLSENPFFGTAAPEGAEHSSLRRRLKELLRTDGKGEADEAPDAT